LFEEALSMTPVLVAPRTVTRALIVTGDIDLARRVQGELRTLGCEAIEIASDGTDAGERCLRFAPELVLIDQLLAGGGAWAVAAELAAQVPGPIVYLCDPEGPLPAAAFVHGLGFVDKPITQQAVARAVGFALHRYDVEAGLRTRAATQHPISAARPRPGPDAATSRLNTELLGSMAHELRAPLQGVMGFATFLRDGKAGAVSETQQQYLDHIATGANHVLQVVNDVLDLTATDSDVLHVRTEPVDPERAAREVLQVLQVIAIRKRIAVEVQVDEQLGHVVSDATKIKQVLYNFVSNALKFTPTGGRVSLNLRRDGLDAFCIEVADTGVGIPRERLSTLFERATAGATSSTGLGLFLTKCIVDALGGTVSVDRGPAGGSVFIARLPIAPSLADGRTRDILLPDDP
jgi:signal transduction histidine kinase